MPDEYVGGAILAEWLAITPRRIIQLVHEGVLTRAARGTYPLKQCVQAYCRYKDQMLLKRGTGGELNEERLLTARLERRKRELEFAKLEGGLITADHHEKVLAEAFALVRTNLRNLPGALAPRLAGLDDPRDVEQVLVPAIDNAMRSIAAAGKLFTDDALPEDMPGRRALEVAGITKLSELMAVRDLTGIAGIGPKTRGQIRDWLSK